MLSATEKDSNHRYVRYTHSERVAYISGMVHTDTHKHTQRWQKMCIAFKCIAKVIYGLRPRRKMASNELLF
jgi:hypothetical protein